MQRPCAHNAGVGSWGQVHDGSWDVAVRPPRRMYGGKPAAGFGALCLQDARGGARQLMETEMPEVKGVWHAEDVALILIDYQKEMFENVKSETGPDEIELNVRFLIRVAKAFNIPVILSTVGVQHPGAPRFSQSLAQRRSHRDVARHCGGEQMARPALRHP